MNNRFINHFRQAIADKKVVSFDVFDTAVVRKVTHPYDIFKLVERTYTKRYGALDFDFYEERLIAEYSARILQGVVEKPKEDITLDEIYDQLAHVKKPEVVEALKKLEIEIECSYTYCDRIIYTLYQMALRAGKRVIFTSDMYLPKHCIAEILQRAGYQTYEDIFVSSEYGVTKHAGKLQKCVLERINVAAGDVLHIGDNYLSDIKQSQKCGLSTLYYPQKRLSWVDKIDEIDVKSALFRSLTISLLNKNNKWSSICDKPDDYRQIGYNYFGPFVYNYCLWIHRHYFEQQYDQVYFLARDGYVIKKAMQIMAQHGFAAVDGQYVYASRRALRLLPFAESISDQACLKLLEDEEIYNRTIVDVFKKWGLDAVAQIDTLKAYNITPEMVVQDSAAWRSKLAQVLTDQRVKDAIQQNAILEKQAIVQYLREKRIDKYKKIMLVDLIVSGNLHKGLTDLASEITEAALHGWYFTTNMHAIKHVENGYKLKGFYVDQGRPFYRLNALQGALGLIESIISAPHPSVLYFENVAGKIVPHFSDEVLAQAENDKLAQIRSGILDYVSDAAASGLGCDDMAIDYNLPIQMLKKLYTRPSKAEANILGALTHFDIGQGKKMGMPLKKYHYLLAPKRAARHFKDSVWKQAYIVNLFGEWALSDKVKAVARKAGRLRGR